MMHYKILSFYYLLAVGLFKLNLKTTNAFGVIVFFMSLFVYVTNYMLPIICCISLYCTGLNYLWAVQLIQSKTIEPVVNHFLVVGPVNQRPDGLISLMSGLVLITMVGGPRSLWKCFFALKY